MANNKRQDIVKHVSYSEMKNAVFSNVMPDSVITGGFMVEMNNGPRTLDYWSLCAYLDQYEQYAVDHKINRAVYITRDKSQGMTIRKIVILDQTIRSNKTKKGHIAGKLTIEVSNYF